MDGRAFVLMVVLATVSSAGALCRTADGARETGAAARDDVAEKVGKLSSADAKRRAAAACALAALGPQAAPAVPSLVRLLADEAAVEPGLLCYRGIEPSSGGEFEGLWKPSPGEAATQALIAIGRPAVEPLVGALGDGRPQVRRNAAWALAEIRDERAADPLVKALGDEAWQVRSFAAIGLGELGSRQAVEPLVAALRSERNAQVRWYVAASLGRFRDPRVIEPLVAALKDEQPRVRAYAAASLGQLQSRLAVEPLIAALADESAQVRMYAAASLGQMRDPRANAPLNAALNDRNQQVRAYARAALDQLRD